MMTHAKIDERLHALVAACLARMAAEAALKAVAATNLHRWPDGRRKTEWRGLLAWPLEELRQTLLADNEAAKRLRQDAPLGGLLPPGERMEILRRLGS